MKNNKQIKRKGYTICNNGMELSMDTSINGALNVSKDTTILGTANIQNTLTVQNNAIKEGRIGIGKKNPDLALDIEVSGKNHDGIQIKKKGSKAYAFKAAHDSGGGYFHMNDKNGDWQISMMANEKKIKIGSVELNEDELKLFKIMNKPVWNIYTHANNSKSYICIKYNDKLMLTNASQVKLRSNGRDYTIQPRELDPLPLNFVFEKEGEYYRIKHDATETYIEFSGNNVKLGKKKDENQLIRFTVNSNGSFLVQPKDSKQYMYYALHNNLGLHSTIKTMWHISPGKIDLHTFLREL